MKGGGTGDADSLTKEGRTTWDELVAVYLRDLADRGRSIYTVRTYETALVFWRRALVKYDPAALHDPPAFITLAAIRDMLRTEEALRSHPRTRRIRTQALDGLIRACLRAGLWPADNPVRRLPKMRIRRVLPAFWTIPVARDFLQKLPTVSTKPYRDTAIFRLYLATGLRLNELIRLTRDDIDWSTHRLHVLGKGGKERRVPMSEPAERDLERYLATRQDDSPWLFTARAGRPFSPSGMEKLFVRLCQRTGHYRPGFSIRNLRHTALSALLHEGLDLPSIQAIAGHENLTTTEGYLHMEPEALVNRVRAKNPWDRGPPRD